MTTRSRLLLVLGCVTGEVADLEDTVLTAARGFFDECECGSLILLSGN